MSDIFISYKREDENLVRALVDKLSNLGWSIWWDKEIPAGRDYDSIIEEELESCKCAIVLWSKNSILSRNVKAEANEALNAGKYIPVLIGDTRPPLLFRYIQGIVWNEMIELEENNFNQLIKHIKRLLGEPPGAVSSKQETEIKEKKKLKTITSKPRAEKK
ncbi:MAG: toll/interleukin-1 receptor domain-containing protein [Bacteroidota bacterium]|nr:toll/interleukin-1 receptor domain-containing protein [Bacteroidota bacterium]